MPFLCILFQLSQVLNLHWCWASEYFMPLIKAQVEPPLQEDTRLCMTFHFNRAVLSAVWLQVTLKDTSGMVQWYG